MLIFDIGANKYKFVEACFEKHEKCSVIAVDPILPETLHPLHRQTVDSVFKRHGDRITVVQAACGASSDEEITFYMNLGEPGISTTSKAFLEGSRFALGNDNILETYRGCVQRLDGTIAFPDLASFKKGLLNSYPDISSFLKDVRNAHNETRLVAATTLDDLIAEYGTPELIKIDVEGYEAEVLKGLSQRVPKICFEWNEEMDSQLWESLDLLRELDYTQFGVSGYFVEEEPPEKLSYDEGGDTYLLEPAVYYNYEETMAALQAVIKVDRRINWGMAWAKE
jgi:FkbM family methyltransferase